MAEKEYIERGTLLRMIEEQNDVENWLVNQYNADWIYSFIDTAPTANVVEVVHGEWIGIDGDSCSVCGRSPSEIMDADSYYAIGFNINELVACPFCGAKMNGGNKNG